jgi:hypothetical protein
MSDSLKPSNMFALILGAFMVFVYAGVGVIFLFFPDIINAITGTPRFMLGILFIIYSAFRIYRIIKKFKERDEEA